VLAASLTFLVATGMPALADDLKADTDTLHSGFQNSITITECSVPRTNSAAAEIRFQGTAGHFAGGAIVTVTATPNAARNERRHHSRRRVDFAAEPVVKLLA